MKKIDEDLDLSLIKENDLDKTAAFTDLMSRSERKKYRMEKNNEEATVEFKTDDLVMQVADEKKVEDLKLKKELTKDLKNEKKEKKKMKKSIEEIEEENLEKELSKTQKLLELTSNMNLYDSNKNSSLISAIFLSIIILILLGSYVFSILSASIINEVYLLINGVALLSIVLLYCVIMISTKRFSKIITVIDYIFIILFVIFNLLIYLGII